MFRVDACIRAAVPGDAADLAALARRVFAGTYGSAIPAPTLLAYLDEHFTPASFRAQIAGGQVLLAEADARLAGYARIKPGPAPACVGHAPAVELAQLYIDLADQNRGLGAQLLAAATSIAAARLWLCAWEQNQRALRFYSRHGFCPIGRMAVHVREIVFDDLVLAREPIALVAGSIHD